MSSSWRESRSAEGEARSSNMAKHRERPQRMPGSRQLVSAFQFALREKWMTTGLICLIIVEAVTNGGAILFIKEFLEGLVVSGEVEAVALGAALLLLIWVVRIVSTWGKRVTQYKLARAIELHARIDVLSHLMRLSVGFLESHPRGELIQRVSKDTSSIREALNAALSVLSSALRVITLVGVALLMDPFLTLLGLAAMPLGVPILIWVGRRLEDASSRTRNASVKLVELMVELLDGIRTIKAYNGEEREREFHTTACREIYDRTGETYAWNMSAIAVPDMALGVGLAVIVVSGGVRLVEGTMEWPALLGFLLAVLALQGPIRTIITSLALIRDKQPYADRYFELLDMEPAVQEPEVPRILPSGPPSIRFENVHYQVGPEQILCDLSFEIHSGETVGVVGPTGAGKTTLLNLIARFVDPTAGRVLYSGVDVREVRARDLTSRLALVSQESFLFATDIASNIRYGRPEAEDWEIREAAARAAILEEVDKMPAGFETRVGFGGRPVSGGQAQRINIARALLKNAPLLLLDEATSALDSDTEARVQQAMMKEAGYDERTTVIVAHRLSTLRHADRIIVLDSGQLADVGSHEELLGRCHTYQRLVDHSEARLSKTLASGAGP